ncbi:MAG: hypothetical protein JST82_13805 [Bacteroidetes bacterium]|nr:hypothetical protein [Bacteroidota bacterium]
MKDKMIREAKSNIAIGIGLVALDVIMNGDKAFKPLYFVGGSCGNVMAILAYMDWQTFPVARLANNDATKIILKEFKQNHVNTELVSVTNDGSTPIIIHRVLKDKAGKPKHRFEFRDPETGKYLPSYKPVLASAIPDIVDKKPSAKVLYLDRITRSSVELAKECKSSGGVVFLEPSSIREEKIFNECLSYCDIIKFSSERIPNYKQLYKKPRVALEIETLGEKGLNFRTIYDTNWSYLPAYKISNVFDAAGAGDWCSSGVIHRLLSSGSFEKNLSKDILIEAMNFGQLLGSLNCLFLGARGLMFANSFSDLLEEIQKDNAQDIIDEFEKRILKADVKPTRYVSNRSLNTISDLL